MLVYDSRHESFRDSDLLAVVALLEHLLEKSEIDDSMSGAVADWKRDAIGSGAGTILFDFSAFGAGTPMHASLHGALVSAEAYIAREWGDEIPLDVLNRYDPNVVRFTAYSTARMIEVLKRLRHLIGDPHVGSTPTTTNQLR